MIKDPLFLGTGWSFPPSFSDGGADVEMAAGVADIHQSLQIILGTRPGERIMREEFGCDLSVALFEEIGQSLVKTLARMISDAILYHEPRITLDNLDITGSREEQGLLMIRLEYTVRSTNSRFNMVYPFCINEAR